MKNIGYRDSRTSLKRDKFLKNIDILYPKISSTTFGFVAASSFRENCAVLSSTRKIIQSFELNEDDEDES